MDQFLGIERRQRNLRIVLFVIILATLPFYCAGILLYGTAPQRTLVGDRTNTPTYTPIGRTQSPTPRPSNTPFSLTITSISPLVPTPGQYLPVATRYLSPTPFVLPTSYVIPTSTPAPTLTPYPSNTPVPQATNPPPPTATPIPTLTPLPTQPPQPTSQPQPSPLPPPTDTPPPPVEVTVQVGM